MVFHLFLKSAKPTRECKIYYTLVGFSISGKSGKPVATALSVVLILAFFAKTHLKRNAILTF